MKKILIISTNAIGDTYLSMSAIPYLKNAFSQVEISFVVQRNSEFLFADGSVENIYSIEKNEKEILLSLLGRLRKIRYDFIFSFFPGIVNSFFLKFLKAENKGGYLNFIKKNEWFDKNQYATIVKAHKREKVLWKKETNFLYRIGNVLNSFDIADRSEVVKYKFDIEIKSEPCRNVVIHPFSRRVAKSLSVEQVRALVNYLQNRNMNCTIVGDEKLVELKEEFSEVEFLIKPSVSFLLEKIINCKLISVDSFPLHIADAYNTRFIGLFSNTFPKSVLQHFNKSINFNITDLSAVNPENIIDRINHFINFETESK